MTNAKTTKRALFASAMSMLLCVSMLIGSTFAWFTDTASTGVNTIKAGNLDVELQVKDANGNWVNGENGIINFVNKDGDSNILWEPGCNFDTVRFRVINNGNLALKYKVVVSGIDGDNKLLEVIDFKLMDASMLDAGIPMLAEVPSDREYEIPVGGPIQEFLLRAHMDENAGNEYQNLSLSGIAITVYATQLDHELDSFDKDYDLNAKYPWDGTIGELPTINENVLTISTATELAAFANDVNVNGNNYSGKTVVLANNIDLNNKIWTPIGQTGATQFLGTFDGKGYTISNLNIDSTTKTSAHYSSGLFGWLNRATVKNVKVNGAKVTGNHNVGVIAGYLETSGCTISNCSVIDAEIVAKHANDDACGDKAGVIVGHAGNTGVKVDNCSATNCTVKAGRDAGQIVGAAKVANVTECTATNVTVTATGDCTGANIKNAVIGREL